MIKGTLFAIFALFFITGIGYSYADPFEVMKTDVLEYDGTSATVQFTWNSDESVSNYDVGCISCIPHIVQNTLSSEATMDNVTPFNQSSIAMFYVLAYDSENNVIQAKQIILNLEQ